MTNRHFCSGEKDFYKKLLSDDFYIDQEGSEWYLTLRTIANAQCVRDEQAKFVGELLHSVSPDSIGFGGSRSTTTSHGGGDQQIMEPVLMIFKTV